MCSQANSHPRAMEVPKADVVRSMTDLLSEAQAYATLHRLNFLAFNSQESDSDFSVYVHATDQSVCEFAWSAVKSLNHRDQKIFLRESSKLILGDDYKETIQLKTHKAIMERLNKGAERARETALRKHKEELEAKQAEIQRLFDLAMPMAGRIRSMKKQLAGLAVLVIGLGVGITYLKVSNSPLQTTPPPALQKIEVLSPAFIDAKGVYRSYSSGEPLDPQPKEWRLP